MGSRKFNLFKNFETLKLFAAKVQNRYEKKIER